MDDILCAAQRDPTQKHRFSDITIRALKDIFPLFPDKMKGSAILKKVLAGDGYWYMVKDTLLWFIHTHRGTLALSSKLRIDLLSILSIPPT